MATKKKSKSTTVAVMGSDWRCIPAGTFGAADAGPVMSLDIKRRIIRMNRKAMDLAGISFGDKVDVHVREAEALVAILPTPSGSRTVGGSADRSSPCGLVSCSGLFRYIDSAFANIAKRLENVEAVKFGRVTGLVGKLVDAA